MRLEKHTHRCRQRIVNGKKFRAAGRREEKNFIDNGATALLLIQADEKMGVGVFHA